MNTSTKDMAKGKLHQAKGRPRKKLERQPKDPIGRTTAGPKTTPERCKKKSARLRGFSKGELFEDWILRPRFNPQRTHPVGH